MPIIWNQDDTPSELHELLRALGERYPIRPGKRPGAVRFVRSADAGKLVVGERRVEYGSLHGAARGVALLLAGLTREERCDFLTTGVMLDASRNAVPKVEWLKSFLCHLALLGFNQLMLYTEDTYECPDEPYFGYCRGRYTRDELREIDDHAARLGVEVVPCIQTLGHLEQLLKHPAYRPVTDTENVLLVDEEKTYLLIEKMLRFWSGTLRSRRIHLGMDEAHSLGRGAFLDRHGLEGRFSIFTRHLARVRDLCASLGLKPMIWSDMYFRMSNPEMLYYMSHLDVTDAMRAALPQDVQLVYWDYYHWEEKRYLDMIAIHRSLGFEPVMASAVWTFTLLWHEHEQTRKTVPACVNACRGAGIKELIFSMWGDDGAYCDFDSAEAGLALAMEQVWRRGDNAAELQRLYRAVTGGNYALVNLASLMQTPQPEQFTPGLSAASALWDDPLLAIFCRETRFARPQLLDEMLERLNHLVSELAGHRHERSGGDLDHAWNLCRVISLKLTLRLRLEKAFAECDDAALPELLKLAGQTLPKAVSQLQNSFRRQWLRRNKPFGLEVIQIRLAGLCERCKETARRLRAPDVWKHLPELELQAAPGGEPGNLYRSIATGCRTI